MNFDLDLSIAVLDRSPAALRALLEGVGASWVRGTEGPDTFSPFDVVGHLIDGEETDWIPRSRIILAGGPNPAFEPFDRFPHPRLERHVTVPKCRLTDGAEERFIP